jgi:hemolysin activation/secretion protein
MTWVILLGVGLGGAVWCSPGVQAQERLGVEPPRRPGPVEPSFPTEPPPPALPRPQLPPIPPPPPEDQERLPVPRVFVRQINILGSTVFSDAELAAATAPYVNRSVTTEDLEALRLALTRLYVNAGYINSGAILPDQTVTAGVITFRIIEGELTDVMVAGNRWFRDHYLRSRLTVGVKPPLNIATLQERLQLLQRDDRIKRLEAELRPGVRLGESELHVHVEERLPFFVALEFDNYQSPTIGAERGLVTVAHRNLTGHGDILRVTYGRSAGLDLQIDTSYILPLSPRETTVSLRYQRNSSSVVEERFADLDIASRSEIWTLTLRHPVYRTLWREFALTLSGEHLRSDTFLRGEPFPFAPGADEGKTRDTALRFALEWLDRTPRQVIAARWRFSLGVDALGATINDDSDLPDGRFLVWLGQFQWARRLDPGDMQVLFRLDVQLTTEPLVPLEQIAIGGRFSVRGYRENQLVRDNGLIVSLESRIPLIRNTRWAEFVQVVPFVDVGRGWNRKVATPDPTMLVSIGLGLRWAATWPGAVPLRTQLEVFWGYRLKHVETEGGDIQDKGFHLQFVLAAF